MSARVAAPGAYRELRAGAPLKLRASACLAWRTSSNGECTRCSATCPANRITVGPDGPVLREGCDGCGRCAVDCPTGALRVPGFAVTPSAAGSDVVIDCWRVPLRSGVAEHALRVPCLGGLTAARLLAICADAAERRVRLYDRGFCSECPAGGEVHPAANVLTEVTALLEAVGIPATRHPRLEHHPLAPGRVPQTPAGFAAEERMDRRAFFRGMAARTVGVVEEAAGSAPTATASDVPVVLQGRSLPEERARLLAALRRLAPERPLPPSLFPVLRVSAACADHRVCTAICPTGALFGYEREGVRGIAFLSAACVQCGACTGTCPEQALTLLSGGGEAVRDGVVALTRFIVQECRECGREFVGNETSCPACRRNRHVARSAFEMLFGDQHRQP